MSEFPGVPAALSKALNDRGYTDLTPVQDAVLDPALSDADLLVSAQTGSGKTVAFGIAIGPNLLGDDDRLPTAGSPLALVVAPTRELALQVKRELFWLYEDAGAQITSCVGGMDMRDERRNLARGAHIVVGTPGRLVDHISRGSLDIGSLEAVVLDEADEMLDLGFREDLETILAAAPEERRTLMFSATVSRPIAALAKNYQRHAVRLNTVNSGDSQHGDIDYRALTVAQHDVDNAIVNVLRYYEAPNAIVFCGTRANVNHLTARLGNRGFSVVALSGELDQKARSQALQAMRDGRARVCVATDVAARGIDLPGLELVIHADLPKNTEGLLHRSGRTGRAGRKGTSVLITPVRARKRVERLLYGAKIKAEWANPPSADDVLARDDERLLNDSRLAEPMEDADRKLAQSLIEQHGAEQVAAAFVRMHRGNRSAPEELSEAPAGFDRAERGPRDNGPREEFKDSVWVALSVGRARRAEPRWLLPMLCKAGGLNKADIGAIRIQENETFVQLNAKAAQGFLSRIEKKGELENNISVSRAEGPPSAGGPRGKARAGKKSFQSKPRGAGEGGAPRRAKPGKNGDKPWADARDATSAKPFKRKKRAPK